MDVDEAGRDHQVGGVDDALGIVGKLRRDRDDAVAGNRNVGLEGAAPEPSITVPFLMSSDQAMNHPPSDAARPRTAIRFRKMRVHPRQLPPSLWKTMVERVTNLSP